MFSLCYVAFHLTAPFHTIPWGPESGDREVHVTLIIFSHKDKDTGCRDSALVLLLSCPDSVIVWGLCVSSRQKGTQEKQAMPILCAEALRHTEPYCVYTLKTCTHVNPQTHGSPEV